MLITLLILIVILTAVWPIIKYYTANLSSLKNKRVLICGASQGLGRALALQYAAYGASVVAVARSSVDLHNLVDEIHRKYPATKAYALAADLSQPSECQRLINEGCRLFSQNGLDILVLNHIKPFMGAFEDMSDDDIQAILNVNLISYVFLTKYALPLLKQSHGSIAIMSSVAGQVPTPFVALYSGGKHFLHGWTDSLRSELTKLNTLSGVSFTTCVLGLIDTTSLRQISKGYVDADQAYKPEVYAKAIVQAVTARLRTFYFPTALAFPISVMYRLFPTFWDVMVRANVESGGKAH